MRTTELIAAAAGSSGSSGVWFAVMGAAFLLAAGATGAAIVRRHPADDPAGESDRAESTADE